MITQYYLLTFAASIVLTLIYTAVWHKHNDISITLCFVLIPVVNLGYVLRAWATNTEEAVAAQKIIYIGGCFLIFILMFVILEMCRIPISRLFRMLTMMIAAGIYATVLTIGFFPLFYAKVYYDTSGGEGALVREYGPMHTVFRAVVILCFAVCLGLIVYTYLKNKQVSRRILTLLFIPEVFALIAYVFGPMISSKVELMPVSYLFAQVMYLFINRRLQLYDMSDTAMDSLLASTRPGIVSVDFKNRYLGSSDEAQEILPELLELTVDGPAGKQPYIAETLLSRIPPFRENEENQTFMLQRDGDERIFLVRIQYLYGGSRKRGYQFVFMDDTKNQQYISLINNYNADLEKEVKKKTENLVSMHNKLVLGMATMVESRDNSTGGHIRRTSEGVRILIEEMLSPGDSDLPEKFCTDIIKAAPMHDLGKIAVDDAVLRKPGRFTPEEFEIMKKHAAEGAHIVHEILRDTDDEPFRKLAENVAHYHHERWDGSGYPEGLKGTEIPLEARIMAIADVYDALVSKRVYKEAMSFEKADSIIMDGMGKHFDASLKPYYVSARPKLEAYYRSLDA